MLNQQYIPLRHIDSFIEPLLKRVLETNKLGICCGKIQVESTSSSCDKAEGDCFKLSIPYAKQILTWNILFDSQCPELGPDFIFNDDDFLIDMNIDTLYTKVPSLANWNVNNKDALQKVLMELLLCYKQHQTQLLQKQERLEMEYSTLLNVMEITQEDVEVLLLPFGSKPIEAKFLISLSIDVPQLEDETFISENHTMMLLVTFYGPNWNRITPQIFFSKRIQQVLSGKFGFQLPQYSTDKLLSDYVMEIQKKIRSMVYSFMRRRNFCATLHGLQPGSVLEFDAIKFFFISILLGINDFYCVINIKLPPSFPSNRPIITILSIYHMTRDRLPYKEKVENFEYSPSWTQHQMVTEIIKSLHTHIVKFKVNSIQTCS